MPVWVVGVVRTSRRIKFAGTGGNGERQGVGLTPGIVTNAPAGTFCHAIEQNGPLHGLTLLKVKEPNTLTAQGVPL